MNVEGSGFLWEICFYGRGHFSGESFLDTGVLLKCPSVKDSESYELQS